MQTQDELSVQFIFINIAMVTVDDDDKYGKHRDRVSRLFLLLMTICSMGALKNSVRISDTSMLHKLFSVFPRFI